MGLASIKFYGVTAVLAFMNRVTQEIIENVKSELTPRDSLQASLDSPYYQVLFYNDDNVENPRDYVIKVSVDVRNNRCGTHTRDITSMAGFDAIARARAFIESQGLILV